MPSLSKSIPPDLTIYSEHARRKLYDVTAEVHFPDDPDPEEYSPDYSPEEAGLMVLWVCGRWFAVWRRLEIPPDRPERERWEILRIEPSTHTEWGIEFHEAGE